MKLSEYLSENKISVAAFAAQIGTSRQAVYSYLNGIKLPSTETYLKIAEATNGQVTPNDFYDIPIFGLA